jgi:chaperone modulatory protein CbpM
MKTNSAITITTITAELIDEDVTINLFELSRISEVHAEFLIDLIEHGALEPLGTNPVDWQFDSRAIKRACTAVRLNRDFNIEPRAIALVLDLLEELQLLREKVTILERQGL